MAASVQRRILSFQDMAHWKSSPAYSDYCSFVRQLNDAARGCFTLMDTSIMRLDLLIHVHQLMDQLSALVDKVQPLQADQSQRFGNKAFRIWFDQMAELVSNASPEWGDTSQELEAYLIDSFGNKQRIDYGTGHEMNFVVFMLGLYKFHVGRAEDKSPAALQSVLRQLLCLFATSYLPLVRRVQLRYKLEPAGSHGVFSLDDFQFLPFVWGSAQLVNHPKISPATFHEISEAEGYAGTSMFHAAVQFIHQVKSGPFFEHSNQLWNISAVESWTKVNKGLLMMYADEVLAKFPIVQHLLFGPTVLRWSSSETDVQT